jgi:hypothetical protein
MKGITKFFLNIFHFFRLSQKYLRQTGHPFENVCITFLMLFTQYQKSK